MRKLAILFLIAIVLLQSGMKIGIVAYYEINKAYIAANLCENKEKPKMGCNGHCYLSKKIKAQEEGEKHIPSVLKGIQDIVLFCSSYNFSVPTPKQLVSSLLNHTYLVKHYTSPFSRIFQPPQ